MDLRQLEIFVKVAELKSFSKAAQALRLTQPTISEHIRTLEQELGVRLLDRLGRGAEATRAGQLLLSHATRMLQLQRETLQAMDSFQGRLAGDLHVAASTIPGEYVLPSLIGRFKEKFPDIVISLLIGDSRAVVDWVIDGRAEVAVVGAKLAHRGIEYRELMPDELVVVVPVAHPWHGKKEIGLADLRAEALLLREQGSGTRAAFESALAQAGQDLSAFRIVGEMGSTQAIKQAVKAGVGVSVISRRAVEEECRSGLVWCLKIRDLKITRAFHIATHRDRSRSPLAEAFRSFLEAESS
ncbi:MAG TPA: selenium metabolism-associated LysR family transcriptional regulator [Candidatus Acidoferrales bacterium]|jgi:DNA-binding transcriptional LysR family regulator|nr:selenium metabolism-associated LysR family transcriptional regulator [Candidatus Acidoferrales bacterium]